MILAESQVNGQYLEISDQMEGEVLKCIYSSIKNLIDKFSERCARSVHWKLQTLLVEMKEIQNKWTDQLYGLEYSRLRCKFSPNRPKDLMLNKSNTSNSFFFNWYA